MQVSRILLIAAGALLKLSHCNEYVIDSPEAFVQFALDVNSGTNFLDDTVVLDCDIDFAAYAGAVTPVGYTRDQSFAGIFIGQGHVIRNLHINASERYSGLFGYSRGATIKNFMLDESCSVTSTYVSPNDAFVGGVLGRCYTSTKPCVFDNAVSKAAVTYAGRANSDVGVGGIVGSCEFSNYYCSIKNCANFGTVMDAGTTPWFSVIGGIVALSSGSDEKRCKLHNNLNYGALVHRGSAKDVVIGGIVGNMRSVTNVQNCVSAGPIANERPGDYNHVGGLAGYAFTQGSSLDRNFWFPDVGAADPVGYNSSAVHVANSRLGAPSESMLGLLNRYAASQKWDMWALNLNRATFTLRLNGAVTFASDYQVIQIPDFSLYEGYTFSGLFMDEALEVPVTNFVITEDTTVYSSWTLNEYTITFVFNDTHSETATLNFTDVIDLPLLPERPGLVARWCTMDNTTCDPNRMHPMDLVMYPRWVVPEVEESSSSVDMENVGTASHHVQVTFKMEAMLTVEVEDIIRKHGGESVHEVLTIEDAGINTVVVIAFENLEDAEEFVYSIKSDPAQARKDKIIKILYLDDALFSFAMGPALLSYSVYGLFI